MQILIKIKNDFLYIFLNISLYFQQIFIYILFFYCQFGTIWKEILSQYNAYDIHYFAIHIILINCQWNNDNMYISKGIPNMQPIERIKQPATYASGHKNTNGYTAYN